MNPIAARVARRLAHAINSACAARGDDEANRIALLEEVCGLPLDVQRGLARHFELVYVELQPLEKLAVGPFAERPVTGNSNPNLGLFGETAKGVK